MKIMKIPLVMIIYLPNMGYLICSEVQPTPYQISLLGHPTLGEGVEGGEVWASCQLHLSFLSATPTPTLYTDLIES